MKLIKLIAVATALIATATATEFGAGPDVYARAYERVHHGYYQVYGDGLAEGFYFGFDYSDTGVSNQEELMSPLRVQYLLTFENYKSEVYEDVQIFDAEGNQVFTSYKSWRPEETLSDDGFTLSYRMPYYAGKIWLQLADQIIPFDGDFAQVELYGGYTFDLGVHDGFVVVPGWVYQMRGAFVEWKNGGRVVTDIQTGLPVLGGKEILDVASTGVSGITLRNPSGRYLSIYSSWDWNTTFEVTMLQGGELNLWFGDGRGNFPQGVWITTVGSGQPAVYLRPNKGGVVYYDVEEGETIHIKQYWPAPEKG